MSSDGMVKLTNEDIKWLVIRVNSGFFTVKKAARVYEVTERRVQQLVKMYRDNGVMPRLNPNRRPKTCLKEEQKAVIDEGWEETRCGARLLFYELRRQGHRIPHNKIHQYLRETGWTTRNPRKPKQRKRCRYERNIRVIWCTNTGIGPRKTIRTSSFGWMTRQEWRLPEGNSYVQLTWNRSSRAIQRCAEQSTGVQYLDTRGEYRSRLTVLLQQELWDFRVRALPARRRDQTRTVTERESAD